MGYRKSDIENGAKNEISKQIGFENFENAYKVGSNTWAFETYQDIEGKETAVWVEVKLVAKNFITNEKNTAYDGFSESKSYEIEVVEKAEAKKREAKRMKEVREARKVRAKKLKEKVK